jgi:hypothetical protein
MNFKETDRVGRKGRSRKAQSCPQPTPPPLQGPAHYPENYFAKYCSTDIKTYTVVKHFLTLALSVPAQQPSWAVDCLLRTPRGGGDPPVTLTYRR